MQYGPLLAERCRYLLPTVGANGECIVLDRETNPFGNVLLDRHIILNFWNAKLNNDKIASWRSSWCWLAANCAQPIFAER